MDSPSSSHGGALDAKLKLADRKKALLSPSAAGRSPLRRVSAPFSGSTVDARCLDSGTQVTALIRQFYVQDKIQWYEKLFGENEENLEEERRKNTTLKQLLKHKEDRIEMLEQENAKLSQVHSKAAAITQQIEEMEVETKYQEKVVEEMEEERETREHRIQYLEEKASSVRSRQQSRGRNAGAKLQEIERQLAQEIAEKEENAKAIEKERQRLAEQQERATALEARLEEMEAVLAAVIEEKQDLQQKLNDADATAVLPREPSIQVDMALPDGDIAGILGMVAAGLREEEFQAAVAVRQFSDADVYFSDVDSMSECDLDSIIDDDCDFCAHEADDSAALPRSGSRMVTARLMGEIANQSTAALATLEGTIIDTIQNKNTQIITTKMELNALRNRLHTALEAQAKNEEQVSSLQAELQVCERQVGRLESQVEEHKEQERLLMRKETERLRNEIATLQKETAERTYDIINLRKGIRGSISTLSRDVHEQVALEYLGSLVDVQSFMEVCLNDHASSEQAQTPATRELPEQPQAPATQDLPADAQPAPTKKKKRRHHHHHHKKTTQERGVDENQPQVQHDEAVAAKSFRNKNITHCSEQPAAAMLAKTKQRHSRTDNFLRHLRLKK